MRLLYNILLHLLFIPILCYLRRGAFQRLGFLPERVQNIFKGKKIVWVHAASVGEVMGISRMVTELRLNLPEYSILISTITTTGTNIARKLSTMGVIYLPLDLPLVVNRVFEMINPKILVITETELWPNLILQAKKKGIKVIIVNGRISEKSIRRYQRIKGLFKKPLETGVDLFCMQTELDAQRIASLGAPSEKIRVTGSAKFDLGVDIPSPEEIRRFLKEIEITEEKDVLPIITAGSIREKEEEVILDAYQLIKQQIPDAVLIIAPRHLQRIEFIKKALSKRNLSYSLRTKRNQKGIGKKEERAVIILDTIGELLLAYAVSSVAIVGGTFVPVGGHNIIEPVTLGKMVLFGPHVSNYHEASKLLIAADAAIQVSSASELADNIIHLLENPDEMSQKGLAGKKFVEENQGASTRNVEAIKKLITTESRESTESTESRESRESREK
ncbi:MAG: 3-deoxy-D-manno-octulosonic acid transferase [bacterium]|nr:3-deoxy-D-manno-octulosonic acid transferase [bacterium]